MVIFETSVFTRQINGLISDDEYRELQHALQLRPDLGDVIPGGGGIRKVRWNQENRGKSGGIRVIYYWLTADDQIFMLLAYAKSSQNNLSQIQLAHLRKLVAQELGNGR